MAATSTVAAPVVIKEVSQGYDALQSVFHLHLMLCYPAALVHVVCTVLMKRTTGCLFSSLYFVTTKLSD